MVTVLKMIGRSGDGISTPVLRTKIGAAMRMLSIVSMIEDESFPIYGPDHVLIEAVEFNTLRSPSQLAFDKYCHQITKSVCPPGVDNCYDKLTWRHLSSVPQRTKSPQNHDACQKSDLSRETRARWPSEQREAPATINQLQETNDLRSGVNVSGVAISAVVAVVVVMRSDEWFVMHARGEKNR